MSKWQRNVVNLTEEDLEEIRSKDLSQRAYAKMFDVPRWVIEKIQKNKTFTP